MKNIIVGHAENIACHFENNIMLTIKRFA